MKLKDFLKNEKISVRLRNSIRYYSHYYNISDDYDIRKINIKYLSRLNNVGKKSIEEFINIVNNIPEQKIDSIVESVVNQFKERSEVGIKKYGTTLQENNNDDFLQHLKEELMDAILYIEKLQSMRK